MSKSTNNDVETLSVRQRLQRMVFPKEKLDPTPMAVPVRKPLTLREEMQRFIRQEFSQQMEANGMPTFEEEDDFEIEDFDDDPDLTTAYTLQDDVKMLYPEENLPKDDLNGDPTPEDVEGARSADTALNVSEGEFAEPPTSGQATV